MVKEEVFILDLNKGVSEALRYACDSMEMPPDRSVPVLIKPNMCCVRSSETGATTDPEIVGAVVNYLRPRFSGDFLIVESDATALNADVAFKVLGYERLAEQVGAKIVNLSRIPSQTRTFPENLRAKKVKVPELFLKPHFLVSIAKMKTHNNCAFTATLKNMFGCNPEPYKARYHDSLHEYVADFASVFRPNLSIVDCGVAMEGCGPVNGTPRRLNALIIGEDPLAVDHLVCRVMGLNPGRVRYMKLAEKKKLGSTRYRVMGNMPLRFEKFKRQPTELVVMFAVKSILGSPQ